jgi:hypothetical protein
MMISLHKDARATPVVRIDSLPNAGVFRFKGNPVGAGQFIAAAQEILGDPAFGTQPQALKPLNELQEGTKPGGVL